MNNQSSTKNTEKNPAIQIKSNHIGTVAVLAVLLFAYIVNIICHQSNFLIMTVFCTFAASESYAQYTFNHKKSYLALTLLCVVAAVIALVTFVMESFGMQKLKYMTDKKYPD